MKEFYANLFQSKDNKIPDINFTETFKNYPITKLSESEASSLDRPLTISELSAALKNMKNNKTPGVDGFPCEFFKVLWLKLKFLISRVLNYSYFKGKLSISLCQSIINCIPKGDKNREF